jgi:hypothetical protein
MTKQHFARLAAALSAARRDAELSQAPISDASFEIVVDQVALACKEFNPSFNYDRFVDACQS